MLKTTSLTTLLMMFLSLPAFAGSMSFSSSGSEPVDLGADTRYYSLSVHLPGHVDLGSPYVEKLFSGLRDTVEASLANDERKATLVNSSPIKKSSGRVLFKVAEAVEPAPALVAAVFSQDLQIKMPPMAHRALGGDFEFAEIMSKAVREYLTSAEGVSFWQGAGKFPITNIPQVLPFDPMDSPTMKSSTQLTEPQLDQYHAAYVRLIARIKKDISLKCIAVLDEDACKDENADFVIKDTLIHEGGLYHIEAEISGTY